MLVNPPVTHRQRFECRFEPVDSNFRWDAMLLFLGFCVFEIEIIIVMFIYLFSFILIVILILLVMMMEISFLGFNY